MGGKKTIWRHRSTADLNCSQNSYIPLINSHHQASEGDFRKAPFPNITVSFTKLGWQYCEFSTFTYMWPNKEIHSLE